MHIVNRSGPSKLASINANILYELENTDSSMQRVDNMIFGIPLIAKFTNQNFLVNLALRGNSTNRKFLNCRILQNTTYNIYSKIDFFNFGRNNFRLNLIKSKVNCLNEAATTQNQFVDTFKAFESKIISQKRLMGFDLDYYCKKTHQLDQKNKYGHFKKY